MLGFAERRYSRASRCRHTAMPPSLYLSKLESSCRRRSHSELACGLSVAMILQHQAAACWPPLCQYAARAAVIIRLRRCCQGALPAIRCRRRAMLECRCRLSCRGRDLPITRRRCGRRTPPALRGWRLPSFADHSVIGTSAVRILITERQLIADAVATPPGAGEASPARRDATRLIGLMLASRGDDGAEVAAEPGASELRLSYQLKFIGRGLLGEYSRARRFSVHGRRRRKCPRRGGVGKCAYQSPVSFTILRFVLPRYLAKLRLQAPGGFML